VEVLSTRSEGQGAYPVCITDLLVTPSGIREYWDDIENLLVDRDINSGINLHRVGLGLFLTLNSRTGKIKVSHTDSTRKEVLMILKRISEAHTDRLRQCG